MKMFRLMLGTHNSWLGCWHHAPAAANVVIYRRNVAHHLTYVESGGGAVRWLTQSAERRYQLTTGAVDFFPLITKTTHFSGNPIRPAISIT